MGLTPEERFKILNEFQGWGNPEKAIWFVGIEEGGDWNRDSCKDDYIRYPAKYETLKNLKFTNDNDYRIYVDFVLQKNYVPVANEKNTYIKGNEYSPENLYKNISNICANLFNVSEYDYNTKFLCRESVDTIYYPTFLTNLYPLGIKNISQNRWSENYEDYSILFGDKILKNKDKYIKHIEESRISVLSQLYNNNKPKITICHGIKYLENFKKYFGVNNLEEVRCSKYRYFINSNDKFIVTYHLSYNNNKAKLIKHLLPIIKEWI